MVCIAKEISPVAKLIELNYLQHLESGRILSFYHFFFSFFFFFFLLNHVQLFATQQTVAPQAPPFIGFPRQEYWSGLHFPLHENFPDQGSNPCLMLGRQILYHWATREVPPLTGWAFAMVNMFHVIKLLISTQRNKATSEMSLLKCCSAGACISPSAQEFHSREHSELCALHGVLGTKEAGV